MTKIDYHTLNEDELAHLMLKLNPIQIQSSINNIAPKNIGAIIDLLQEHNDPSWREKIRAIFAGLTSRQQLEAVGKVLTLPQVLEIMSMAVQSDNQHQWKLSPIFVGLSHRLFDEVLDTTTSSQLQALKHEGAEESIQHHLTLSIHELEHKLDVFGDLRINLNKLIGNLDIHLMTFQEIQDIEAHLQHLDDQTQESINHINKMLSIAWNTNRLDLIEKLTTLKEKFSRFGIEDIGKSTKAHNTTGLYSKLNAKLDHVYGNPSNHEDIEALEDSDPAIEGLTKLSLWYLEDYAEIGLLKVNPATITHDHDQREKLFLQTRTNLEKLGLLTVADLKKAKIYSKNLLKEHISGRERGN